MFWCILENKRVFIIFSLIGGSDYKLIYRHYATLYFVFCVDSSESELGILDLIQVFVETLDKCFESVCELDLIFHMDKVNLTTQYIVTRRDHSLGKNTFLFTMAKASISYDT